MTSKAEPREVKLKHSIENPKPVGKKVFKVDEVDGLLKVLGRIASSNPKIDLKVDYWLNKNQKSLVDAMSGFLEKQNGIVKKYAVTFEDEEFKTKDGKPVVFLVVQGKDDEDTLLRDGTVTFKLVEVDGVKKLDYISAPFWELEVTPAEEGKEAVKNKMQYLIKYKTPEDEIACDEELTKLAEEADFSPELWLLKEDNLEGISVVWASDKQENVSQFKSLLYDNLIG